MATRRSSLPRPRPPAGCRERGRARGLRQGAWPPRRSPSSKGEPPKRKGSKFRKLLFLGTLAAAAGFIYQKVRPKPETDNWQSSYTPPDVGRLDELDHQRHPARRRPPAARTSRPASAPTSRSPPTTRWPGWPPRKRAGDDPGGASPDEAIADAAEEPHDVTTPDDPADVVEVEDETAKKK